MHKITSPTCRKLSQLVALGTTEESAVTAFVVILNAQLLPRTNTNAASGFFVENFAMGLDTFAELKTYMKNVYELEITHERDDAEPSVAIPKTIPQFAEACKGLNADQIYDLFENQIRIKYPPLHSAIYCMAASDDTEPFRGACIEIGERYNIQSLKDY